MDASTSPQSSQFRKQVLREALPELLKGNSSDEELIHSAATWWQTSGPNSVPPRDYLYYITQLNEYARWRASKLGQLHESAFSYSESSFLPNPFQQFLRERSYTVSEMPGDTGLRLEHGLRTLVGDSRIWRDVIGVVQGAAFSDVPTLINGEVGTGKSQIARVIHDSSMRADKPFLSIPCQFLSHEHFKLQIRDLISEFADVSELRGLDALFSQVGTVYLADVDQLPLQLQPIFAEQLRKRHNPESPGGNTYTVPRYIASTNEDINLLATRQLFRHDLFLEIAILQIDLPPLRHRREDIAMLADHILGQLASKYRIEKPVLHMDTQHKLERYPWPGNLSELRTVLDRALLKTKRIIKPVHLFFDAHNWFPMNTRDRDAIVRVLNVFEEADFRIGAAPIEQLIVFLLQKDQLQFKASELAEMLDARPSTARSYLTNLRRLGFVKKHGDRKSTTWSVNQARLLGEEPGGSPNDRDTD